MSVVGRLFVCPYSVTVMVPASPFSVYSSITWLFVTTSPSDVMIMPVPSSSLWLAFTSMETTAWITLFTSSGMVTLPLSTAAPGEAVLSWIVTPFALPLELSSAMAVTPAPTPAPIRAATSATGSQPRHPRPLAEVAEVAGAGGRGPPPDGIVGSTGGGGYAKGTAGVGRQRACARTRA